MAFYIPGKEGVLSCNKLLEECENTAVCSILLKYLQSNCIERNFYKKLFSSYVFSFL